MHPRLRFALTSLAILLSAAAPTRAATPVTGTITPNTPNGQFLSLKMTIDDVKTRFEMVGPDFSFFAFGFDTTTMQGYSLIIQGNDAARTAMEQNLVGVGNPGGAQPTQNLNVISIEHDAANDRSKLIIERPNQTGDPDDPVFSPSMTSLNMIWAYDSFASPASPNPFLDYHGSGGRGFSVMTFAPVPEPGAAALAAMGLIALARRRR